MRIVLDKAETVDGGSIDSNLSPRVWLSCRVTHLQTGLDADLKIVFDATFARMSGADAFALVQSRTFLRRLPEKTTVAGTWTANGSFREFTFGPNAPLTKDKEYLLGWQMDPSLVVERSQVVFRVGSLPRVTKIAFVPSAGAGKKIDAIHIHFSEFVGTKAVEAGLAVTLAGTITPLQLQLLNTVERSNVVGFLYSPGIPLQTAHTIKLSKDVGIAAKLDSTYEGKEGTKDFEVTMTPSTLSNQQWEPSVTF